MIKNFRKTYGFTQQRLADSLGVTQATISKIESGKIKDSYTEELIWTFIKGYIENTQLAKRYQNAVKVYQEPEKKTVLTMIKEWFV